MTPTPSPTHPYTLRLYPTPDVEGCSPCCELGVAKCRGVGCRGVEGFYTLFLTLALYPTLFPTPLINRTYALTILSKSAVSENKEIFRRSLINRDTERPIIPMLS